MYTEDDLVPLSVWKCEGETFIVFGLAIYGVERVVVYRSIKYNLLHLMPSEKFLSGQFRRVME